MCDRRLDHSAKSPPSPSRATAPPVLRRWRPSRVAATSPSLLARLSNVPRTTSTRRESGRDASGPLHVSVVGQSRPRSSGRATRSSRRSWTDSRTSAMRSMRYRRRRGSRSTRCCWNSAGCGWRCCSAALPSSAWRTPAAVAAGLEEERIEVLAQWPTSQRFGPLERACLAFAEQFVIDVAGLDDAVAGAVVEHLGEQGLADFASALVGRRATAASPAHLAAPVRARVVSDGSRSPRVSDGARAVARLRQALSAWQAAVVRLAAVDPVTTELVRLRCARYHDCRT